MVSGALSSVSGSEGGVSSDGGNWLVSTFTITLSVDKSSMQTSRLVRHFKRNARWIFFASTSTPGIWYFTPESVKSLISPSMEPIVSSGTKRVAEFNAKCRPDLVPKTQYSAPTTRTNNNKMVIAIHFSHFIHFIVLSPIRCKTEFCYYLGHQ